MNKNDIRFFVIVLLFVGICFILFHFFQKQEQKRALVYYQNELIMKIPLDQKKQYQVAGQNGNVILETDQGKIRVIEEISPYHLCSNQGWASNTYDVIVCLPNKIVIRLEADNDVDTIVR